MFVYLVLLLLLQVLYTSGSVFFHERSHFTLLPGSGTQESFGFSLAYQKQSRILVTGAPHSSKWGKVFTCPLDKLGVNNTVRCGEVITDIAKLAPYNQELAPELKLNLGSSISATDNYFFTCAPLWMKNQFQNVSGTCFLYDETVHRYETFVEEATTHGDKSKNHSVTKVQIGNGWRTLIDNDWLMVANVASEVSLPYVLYTDAATALAPMRSIVDNDTSTERELNGFRNSGFSIAAGNFFSKETMYAISALDMTSVKGAIYFLESTSLPEGGKKLTLTRRSNGEPFVINDHTLGSMFGAAMCSAHLNLDEWSELLVGAPAWGDKDEESVEVGAVRIYFGGTKNSRDLKKRQSLIIGHKDGSRFGTAIAASDLDGDNLSEIFVSAPYEDLGKGALYIFSGYEIYNLTVKNNLRNIPISIFKLTQRIQNDQFSNFGYSLHVIPDLDGNGCDELAVGAPESGNIMMLRCIPSLNITVTVEHTREKLSMFDTSFQICVRVLLEDSRNRSLDLPITLKNEVKGDRAYIEKNQTLISKAVPGKCINIIVNLDTSADPGDYVFSTSVYHDESKIMNSNDFNPAWAMISPYSKLRANAVVSRRCSDDCNPKFTLNIIWSGGNITKGSSYILGSSESLTASLLITNEGNSSWEACALVRVSGATVAQFGCAGDRGQYKCLLPKGFRTNTTNTIDLKLDMRQPTNMEKEIEVEVTLLDFCNKPNNTVHEVKTLTLHVEPKDITLRGSTHNQYISDTKIQDQRDSKEYKDAHEYWIENKGKIMWQNIRARVTVDKKPFINSSRVADWPIEDFSNRSEFFYTFDLLPESKVKIIVSIDILKDKIISNLQDNKLTVQSNFVLYLHPAAEIKEKRLISTITFQQEQRFAQNKSFVIIVAVIVAFIVLAVIIYVLYKLKFFKRTEKEKLNELKELQQEQVNRRSNTPQQHSASEIHDGLDDLVMEVDDDDAFEIVDMKTPVIQESST